MPEDVQRLTFEGPARITVVRYTDDHDELAQTECYQEVKRWELVGDDALVLVIHDGDGSIYVLRDWRGIVVWPRQKKRIYIRWPPPIRDLIRR